MEHFKEQLAEPTLKLLWSLWTELGVAGLHRYHADCLVDPEALLLVTLWLGQDDPRLLEEARDWCSRYSHLISLQRLKGLARSFNLPIILNTLPILEDWLRKSSQPQAKSLSGKSTLLSLTNPALLMLRLGAMFGVGSRAACLTIFLNQPDHLLGITEITAVTGFSKQNIANTLNSFHLGGLLYRTEVANRLQYRLSKPKALIALIEPLPQYQTGWLFILSFIVLWTNYARQNQTLSTLSKAVAGVKLFKQLEPRLVGAGWQIPKLEGNPDLDLERIQTWVLDSTIKISQGYLVGLDTSFLLPILVVKPRT